MKAIDWGRSLRFGKGEISSDELEFEDLEVGMERLGGGGLDLNALVTDEEKPSVCLKTESVGVGGRFPEGFRE